VRGANGIYRDRRNYERHDQGVPVHATFTAGQSTGCCPAHWWYRIIDAKTGLIGEGYVRVADMLTRQPWPEPGDEFPVHVTGGRRDTTPA
jgi:hypothetical protein